MIELSVIVPIYNAKDTLERCLDSILDQSFNEFEVIWINDGSTDESEKILQEYKKKDKRIIVIKQKNKRLSATRNVGIKNAKGKYVTFIDSDDWIEKDTFKKVKEQMDKNYEIIRINYMINNEKKENNYKNILYNSKQIKEKVIPDILVGKIPSYSWLLYIKLDTLKKNNWYYNEETKYMEDIEYLLNICYSCKDIYFMNEKLYHYFINTNGMTKSKKNYEKNMYYILDIHKKIINIIKKNDKKYEERRKISDTIYANNIINYAYLSYINNNNKAIFKNIEEITSTNQFKEMSKNFQFKFLPQHLRFQLLLVKYNKINLLKIFFKLKAIARKLKSKQYNNTKKD